MAFVSWNTEYLRALDAVADRSWDQYFISSVETRTEMRTMYTKIGNVTEFISWLKMKADEESLATEDGITAGAIQMCIGGG